MRISDWSSDVCSSDLGDLFDRNRGARRVAASGGMDPRSCRGAAPHRPRQRERAMGGRHRRAYRCAARCVHEDALGRASRREWVCQYVSISVVAVSLNKTLTRYLLFAMTSNNLV